MKLLWIIPLCVLSLIALLLLIALVHTLLGKKKVSLYAPNEDEEESLRLAKKLSEMVKYDTTSHGKNFSAFTRF